MHTQVHMAQEAGIALGRQHGLHAARCRCPAAQLFITRPHRLLLVFTFFNGKIAI